MTMIENNLKIKNQVHYVHFLTFRLEKWLLFDFSMKVARFPLFDFSTFRALGLCP